MSRYRGGNSDNFSTLEVVLASVAVIVVVALAVFYYQTQYKKVPRSEWVTDISTRSNKSTEFVTVWENGKSWNKNLYFKHKDGGRSHRHPWNIPDYVDGACPNASSEAQR